MDLESECSILESVEDNEEIAVPENSGKISESKVQYNGSCVVESNEENELLPDLKQKGAEVTGYGGSPPKDRKPEASPSPSSTKKGYGLRKWRRIKRDINRDGDFSIDTGRMVSPAQDFPNSICDVKPSKRTQYAGRKEKSESSVSSTNAVVRISDAFATLDDSGLGLGLGPSLATGTDSENSEDRSSKSSTVASALKIKYEIPAFVGFPRDKSRMRSLSGKNLAHPVQRGQQGKGRTETTKTTKKARGERVKIEKENSHSSMESDSRSSNIVFMKGNYSLNNGMRNERPNDYDEENSDEVMGSGKQVNGHNGTYGKDGRGGFEDCSAKDVVADSCWGVKQERSQNHGSSREHDPLEESIFELRSAQEALEKELLKFKEIGTNISVSEIEREFTRSEQSEDGEGLWTSSPAVQSEVEETARRDAVAELENLFKKRLEAEVEYLAISRMVQKLRVFAVDQITLLEEQKVLVSEQTQTLDKLGDVGIKAAALKKEAEKLEELCEDVASADEILKLRKSVRKYSSCFLLQLALLVVILGVFLSEFSPSHVEVVPT